MPFFPGKTPREIADYLEGLNVKQLTELNHRFGDHFEHISDKIDTEEKNISDSQNKIGSLRDKISQEEYEAKTIEKERLEQLADLTPEYSQAEFILMKKALAYSPLSSFDYEKSILLGKIKNFESGITSSENKIAELQHEIHLCGQELKIVNRILDQKRNAAKLEQSNLATALINH